MNGLRIPVRWKSGTSAPGTAVQAVSIGRYAAIGVHSSTITPFHDRQAAHPNHACDLQSRTGKILIVLLDKLVKSVDSLMHLRGDHTDRPVLVRARHLVEQQRRAKLALRQIRSLIFSVTLMRRNPVLTDDFRLGPTFTLNPVLQFDKANPWTYCISIIRGLSALRRLPGSGEAVAV